ncbi:MAG: peptidoglycan editing factor PgeF [Turicibacter sp.]|nr:peptidoglycan editing factor PgeF [Turicibacter sp.]
MKEPFRLDNPILWLEEWMEKFPVTAGFTASKPNLNIAYHVGDDPLRVYQNRETIAEEVGISLEQWVFAQQLHTAHIHEVTLDDLGAGKHSFESGIPATDGLYTRESGVVLATFYADCTPLYFYAPKVGIVGTAHAGWQGTVAGIMQKMLQTLKEKEGVSPGDIYIAIGPAIGMDAYRVEERVIEKVKTSTVPGADTTFVELWDGQYKFSPKKLNLLQALHEGVPRENILMSSFCTFTDKDLFDSHRRDPKAGRMMAFIAKNA